MDKIEQMLVSLVKISDLFKKIIVTGDNGPVWRNNEGITIIGLFDFLLNEDSLEL